MVHSHPQNCWSTSQLLLKSTRIQSGKFPRFLVWKILRWLCYVMFSSDCHIFSFCEILGSSCWWHTLIYISLFVCQSTVNIGVVFLRAPLLYQWTNDGMTTTHENRSEDVSQVFVAEGLAPISSWSNPLKMKKQKISRKLYRKSTRWSPFISSNNHKIHINSCQIH